MVELMLPATARVMTLNVAVLEAAGTVTVVGMVTGSLPDSDTTAPPAGAALLNVAVPVTWLPPTTLFALRVIEERAAAAVTVSVDDWLLPLIDAVMVAVPIDIPVTVNPALDDPDATVMGVCTVATEGLLLESEMIAPPADAAAARLTVPCTVVPTAMLDEPSATPAAASVVVG
jgi:hypothetical protein